jgi:hypothetical protein
VTRFRTSFDTDEQAVVEALFLGLIASGESEAEAASDERRSWRGGHIMEHLIAKEPNRD